MITSVFKKSTPINYSLVLILMLVFFLMFHIQEISRTVSLFSIIEKTGLIVVIVGSLFIVNFIVKKNGLTKDSTYTLFFYFLFLLFFPTVLNNIRIVVANFFLLLALRKLISLQSLKSSKEKIFDASLWIFIASLFHFWCILYLVLVFISIIFHVSRDYKNWILPFIAFFTVGIIFLFFGIVLNLDIVEYSIVSSAVNFNIDYFTNNYQNLALSIYLTVALFFIVSMFGSLASRPMLLHASFKKLIASFFVGLIIYFISDHKSNDLLLFTFAPLAVMATCHIESPQLQWKQETVLAILIVLSLFCFFSQL